MEYSSYEFLISRWFVHNWFMDLDTPFETTVHYFLIRRMNSLGQEDRVFMVCMVTHWKWPIVNHDIWLLGSHDFIKLVCVVWFFNLERILDLC